MVRRKSRTLTEVELEFMEVIWRMGEVTTQEVGGSLSAKGRKLSGGSIRKMLSILLEKGYLTRRKDGHGFIYKALIKREKATGTMVSDLLKRAFGGKAALMVAALLDSRGIHRGDIEEITRLVAEKEREGEE